MKSNGAAMNNDKSIMAGEVERAFSRISNFSATADHLALLGDGLCERVDKLVERIDKKAEGEKKITSEQMHNAVNRLTDAAKNVKASIDAATEALRGFFAKDEDAIRSLAASWNAMQTLMRGAFVPFSWHKCDKVSVDALSDVLDENARLLDEARFTASVERMTKNMNPRQALDAYIKTSITLLKSIKGLKTKIEKTERKEAENSGCTAAEKETSRLFKRRLKETLDAQKCRLAVVRGLHHNTCDALIKLAVANHAKFYEVAKDCGFNIPRKELSAVAAQSAHR